MRLIGWVLGTVYFLGVLLFALKNNMQVPVYLTKNMAWDGVPLVVLILTSFFAGVIAGWFAWVPRVMRLRKQLRSVLRQTRKASASETPERRADRIADAARSAGAVGDMDADTRTPVKKLTGF